MQQAVKAKVVKVLQEKLEAQNASDESSDMKEVNIRTNFLICYTKQAVTLVEAVLKRYLKVSKSKASTAN